MARVGWWVVGDGGGKWWEAARMPYHPSSCAEEGKAVFLVAPVLYRAIIWLTWYSAVREGFLWRERSAWSRQMGGICALAWHTMGL